MIRTVAIGAMRQAISTEHSNTASKMQEARTRSRARVLDLREEKQGKKIIQRSKSDLLLPSSVGPNLFLSHAPSRPNFFC